MNFTLLYLLCMCVRFLCELGGRVGVFYLFLICCICFICVLSVDHVCYLSCNNSVGGWVYFFSIVLLLICCICCVCDYPVSTRCAVLYSVLNICCLCVRSLHQLLFICCVFYLRIVAVSVYYRNWVDSVGGWVFFLFILT